MITALAATIVLSKLQASDKVTLTSVAMPAPQAIEALAKATSQPLAAAPSMSSEVLVLHLQNASLDEAKKQIALVTSGEWTDVNGVLTLVPAQGVRQQEATKRQNEYAKKIGETLQKMIAQVNKTPQITSANVQKYIGGDGDDQKGGAGGVEQQGGAVTMGFDMGVDVSGPGGRAITRFAQGIGASALGAVQQGQRVVYSNAPTRMQRALPRSAAQIVQSLTAEQNVYSTAIKKMQKDAEDENPRTPQTEAMERFAKMFGQDDTSSEPIKEVPYKVLLIASREELMDSLNIELRLYSQQGKTLFSATQMLHGGSFFGEMAALAGEADPTNPKPDKPAKPEEKALELSESSKELQTAFGGMMTPGGMDSMKLSDTVKAKLLSPDMYDPLGFATSDYAIGTAKARKANLVANLGDGEMSFFSMMRGGAMTPSTWLSSTENGHTVTQKDGWIVIQPQDPVEARIRRTNRAALSKFLKTVRGNTLPSLNDLADYAAVSRPPTQTPVAMTYLSLLAPTAINRGMGGMVNWDMLRFYGALSVTQRHSLKSGNRLGLGQLNPAQKAAAERLLFGSETNLQVEGAEKPEFDMPEFMTMFMRGGNSKDYRTEPTEVMPLGLPTDGYVELKFSQEPIVKIAGDAPAFFGNAALGADEIAMFRLFSESPAMAQMAAFMPKLDKLTLGNRDVYDFKFVVGPGVFMNQMLNDDKVDANGRVVAMNNLPADFQKKIEDRKAALKKLPFFDPEFMNGLGGGGNTPPPSP